MRWMKPKDDVLTWNAGCRQLLCYRPIGAVVLNPDFSTDNVKVDDWAMDTIVSSPAHVNDFVMVSCRIDDRFGVDVTIRGLTGRVLFDQVAHDRAVLVYSIHVMILSCYRRIARVTRELG